MTEKGLMPIVLFIQLETSYWFQYPKCSISASLSHLTFNSHWSQFADSVVFPPKRVFVFCAPPSSIVFTPPHTEQLAPHQNPNLWCDSSNATASVFFLLRLPIARVLNELNCCRFECAFRVYAAQPVKGQTSDWQSRKREKKIETETENDPPPC